MDGGGRDILASGGPEEGRRPPSWARRILLAVAVVAVAALVGRELLAGEPGDGGEAPVPSTTGPEPGYPQSFDSGSAGPSRHLLGALDGRIVRIPSDGMMRRGPSVFSSPEGVGVLEGTASPDGAIPFGPPGVGWGRRLLMEDDGRVLYVIDGTLRVLPADLSGPGRPVTRARGVLPCDVPVAQACVVTPDGRVARVQIADGTVMDTEMAPRRAYAGGDWRPSAVLDDGSLVMTRGARGWRARPKGTLKVPVVDVALVSAGDDSPRVVYEGAQLLWAQGSLIVALYVGEPNAPPTLSTYAIDDGRVDRHPVYAPPGWRFLSARAGLAGTDVGPRAVVFVERHGRRALAAIEVNRFESVPRLVPGSLGADPDAGIAGSRSGGVAFWVDARAPGFAWWPASESTFRPARRLSHDRPPGFRLVGVQVCPRPDGSCAS